MMCKFVKYCIHKNMYFLKNILKIQKIDNGKKMQNEYLKILFRIK